MQLLILPMVTSGRPVMLCLTLSSADSPSATCFQGKPWVTNQLLYSRTPSPQRRDQALGISPNLSQILQMIRQSFDQSLQMLRSMEQLWHQHCRLLYRPHCLLKPKEAIGNLGLAPHCWQVAPPCSCPPPLPPPPQRQGVSPYDEVYLQAACWV